ncbi:myb-like protein F [Aphidius gifuensis]|uniref:myb-like protein F n=1 Tax=Aphidius gifuensis TaxID=684658 RepID=UPI001CDB6A0C|nr:myb-like protein F [Aphidius gifuensis]
MDKFHDGYEFYKKMMELQEKLGKSEEERIRLEERFNNLEKESRIRHESCINKLRMKYIEFLEEEKIRDERNNMLLDTLKNIDTNLALMSAKTDRLQWLKKQYEASVGYTGVSSGPRINSATGDSGIIVSQNDKKPTENFQYPLPGITKKQILDKEILSWPLTPSKPANLSYNHLASKIHGDSVFIDQQESDKNIYKLQPSIIRKTDDDLQQQINNYKYDSLSFKCPEKLYSQKNTKLCGILSKTKEEYAGDVLENELEKYISKIRGLHDRVESQKSIDEYNDYEENTSGDILNVTLFSDDGTDHLPIEDKKVQFVSQEVVKILSLADDLASRTIDDQQMFDESIKHEEEQLQSDTGKSINSPDIEIIESSSLNSDDHQVINKEMISPKINQIKDNFNENSTGNLKLSSNQQVVDEIIKPNDNITSHQTAKNKPEDNSINNSNIVNKINAKEDNKSVENLENKIEELLLNSKIESHEYSVISENEEMNTDNYNEIINYQEELHAQVVSQDDENIVVKYPETQDNDIKVLTVDEENKNASVTEYYHNDNEDNKIIYNDEVPQLNYDPQEYVENADAYVDHSQYDGDGKAQHYMENNQGNGILYDVAQPVYDTQQEYVTDNVQYNPGDGYSQYQDDPKAQQYVEHEYQQYTGEVGNQEYPTNYTDDPNGQYYQQYTEGQGEHYATEYPQDMTQQQQVYNDPNYDYTNYNETQMYQVQDSQQIVDDDNTVLNNETIDNENLKIDDNERVDELSTIPVNFNNNNAKKNTKNVIKSIIESDTDSTIENNVSNTESDFDFNM